jgi:hypothetical protein
MRKHSSVSGHKTKLQLRFHNLDTIHSLSFRYVTSLPVKAMSVHTGPPVNCLFLLLVDLLAWVSKFTLVVSINPRHG